MNVSDWQSDKRSRIELAVRRPSLVALSADDAERIAALEEQAFAPGLRASADTMRARFALGHRMLGIEEDGELAAMVGYYYGDLAPGDWKSIASSERQLCLAPNQPAGKTLMVYNLEVIPHQRGASFPRRLLRAVLREAKSDGLVHAFGNARMPSYAGSGLAGSHESIAPCPIFRSAVDRYLAGGAFPTRAEFDRDVVLRLYRKLTGCRFLAILPDYAPDDGASGGMRALVYRSLLTWP